MQLVTNILRGLFLLPALACGVLTVIVLTDKDTRLMSLLFGAICLQFLWCTRAGHHSKQRRLILSSVATGLVIGAIALYGGMIWAQWRYPDSNLAPILGFIATGPLGYAVGSALGILLGNVLQRRKDGRVSANKVTDNVR